MPKFSLDGKEIACDPGTTILQAALRENRELPHYCYHPKLSIAGNCRICLVEVEKAPKLLIACSTVVTEGMVVRTASPKAVEGRRGVMEFLLINHPLDCPICDQTGECRLQEYSVAHGSGESRFIEEKVRKRKRVEIGPHVLLDEERCILCTRCIRFCQEITETSELDCMIVVETIPKSILFQVLSVVFCSSFSNTPPVKALNPSSRKSIPNKNIETPAAISLKSGLTQNP